MELDDYLLLTVPEPVPRAGMGRAAGRSSGMNCTGQYSRRSSEDSTTDEAALPANVREMRVRNIIRNWIEMSYLVTVIMF